MNVNDIEEIAKVPAFGDDVLRRYRYQHLYTILLAIQMYRKEIPYKQLFCELADDVLGVLSNDKLVSIQIKTSESKPEFSHNDPDVIKSINRFINLDQTFPNTFEEFIFVSNVGFKKNKDLNKIIKLAKEKPNTLNSDAKEFIEKLSENNSTNKTDIIRVLSKTKTLKGPSLDNIESKIETDYLSKIEKCSAFSVPKLSSLLNILVLVIYKKSSKVIENSIKDYVAFVEDGEEQQLQHEVKSKQILPDTIAEIVENETIVYLVSNNPTKFQLKSGTVKLMEQKMAAGGIGTMEISSMKNLAYSACNHFFEEYNKRNGEPEIIKQEIDHLQTLLENEAAESETDTKNDDALYGTDMLRSLEGRIRNITRSRSGDVFGIKYEILKGIIGILTGDCKIWFNNEKMRGTN